MKAKIQDPKALLAISPTALSAYARSAGWSKLESYGDHSDVYTGEGLPEIILPLTQRLGDYANVVSHLIEIFARAADMDELILYRDLVTSDRDVIRIRVAESEDGSVTASDGISLVTGAHDMLLAAACSLRDPQPFYRAGANREASDYLERVRLGQTEQSSFAVTLLTPAIPPPIHQYLSPEWALDEDPIGRRMTKRLAGALAATRKATERTAGGDPDAFSEVVQHGVSANLCDALVRLIEPFRELDTSLVWARTRPMETVREIIRFAADDEPILREAARLFRAREPKSDVRLFGFVYGLKRDEEKTDGTITLWGSVDGQNRSVTAVLEQSDYERAVQAHEKQAPIIVKGDLEYIGQRWSLLNPRIADVIQHEDALDESE